MRRDYDIGLDLLTDIIKRESEVTKEFLPNCYCCRAYGLFCS